MQKGVKFQDTKEVNGRQSPSLTTGNMNAHNNDSRSGSPGGGNRASIYTTATSDSNTSASNLANRIMQTRGYCIPLPEYTSNTNSLKDRIREQLRNLKSKRHC